MVDDIVPPAPRRQTPGVKPADEDNASSNFETPEAVARQEEVLTTASLGSKHTAQPGKPKGKDKKPSKLKAWWGRQNRTQKLMVALLVILLLAGLAWGAYQVFGANSAVEQSDSGKRAAKEAPKPTTEASRLTGIQITPELNALPVTGIMIENSPDARPQAGLKDAGVIFEAIAEGGITRFLCLYLEAQPDYVGPVRSVRPYYLQWAQGFDAAIAHVGGSPAALAKMRNEGIKDLDQSSNGGSFQRITARYAPHNVYTSLASMLALQKSKGFTSTFTGFVRKADAPSAAPNAKTVDLAISAPFYNVHYDYNAATNSYNRSQGGAGHIDETTKQSLSPRVVIALVLPQGIDPDGVHTSYNTLGSGTAYIFQDGSVTQGIWTKGSDKEQFRFGDANGAPIGLNAGQTWITMVSAAAAVTHAP